MSHYAQLDENNIVIQVLLVNEEKEKDDRFFLFRFSKKSPEYFGVKFLQKLFPNTRWKKTCNRTFLNEHLDKGVPFRGNYAAIGGIYDEENDVFYLPQPEPSFVLDQNTWGWKEPYPPPSDRWEDEENWYFWQWSEESYNQDKEKGYVITSVKKPDWMLEDFEDSGCPPTEDELKLL